MNFVPIYLNIPVYHISCCSAFRYTLSLGFSLYQCYFPRFFFLTRNTWLHGLKHSSVSVSNHERELY